MVMENTVNEHEIGEKAERGEKKRRKRKRRRFRTSFSVFDDRPENHQKTRVILSEHKQH